MGSGAEGRGERRYLRFTGLPFGREALALCGKKGTQKAFGVLFREWSLMCPFFPGPARATNKPRFVKHSVGRQGGWGKQRERGGLYCSRKKGESAIWIAHWLVSRKGATGYLVRPLRMPTKF